MTSETDLYTPSHDSDLTSRARIRNAGLHQFAISGFAGTPMRAIASEADVAIGLISHYYGSKEGLREAIESWIVDLFANAIARADAEDGESVADAASRDASVAAMLNENPLVVAYLRRQLLDFSGEHTLITRLSVLTEESVESMREHGRASKDRNRVSQVLTAIVRQLGKLFLEPMIDQVLASFPEEERPAVRPELHVEIVQQK